jgi:lipopolysaccharide/colanic/teichoic acid biosynthesis glycosyltransferase
MRAEGGLPGGGTRGAGARIDAMRPADVFIATLGLLLIWPLLALLAALVRLESPGSPFFLQTRVGKDGRPFRVFKLRTMRADAPRRDLTVGDFGAFVFQPRHDPRHTQIGRVLRMTSFDEALQLLNVLRGEMAIVGPRPEIPEVVAQYPPAFHERHRVRPGLTGLAQINGRAELTVATTIAYDIAYARHRSARLDISILLRTAAVVLRKTGAR